MGRDIDKIEDLFDLLDIHDDDNKEILTIGTYTGIDDSDNIIFSGNTQ